MQEEISLRELIEILLKGKKLIAVITVIAIVLTCVVNFLVLDPVYEARAILVASSLNSKNQNQSASQGIEELNSKNQNQSASQGIEELLDSISQYPQLSLEAYKEQIKNPQILDQVIEELNLDEKDINRVNLRDMITLNTIQNTNLITISVKNSDPALAADIANTVAKKFTAHITEIAKSQADKSSNYIKTQMEIEKENLDAALLEYKNYLAQPKGLLELQKEVDSKTDLITQYKNDLLNTEIEENKIIASLEAAKRELANTSEKIILKKTIADDTLLSQYIGEKGNSSIGDVLNIDLESEEINEVYTYLKNQISDLEIKLSEIRAQKEALSKAIETTANELEVLQVELAEKQHQDRIMKQKVDFAQSTYEAFLNKYEETRILKSSDIGEASIIIASPAVEPLTPVGPKKMLNMAIAAVLGLMIGVIVVFFKEYWQKSGNAINNTNISLD